MLLLGGSPATLRCGDPPLELAGLFHCAAAEVEQVSEALPNSVLGQLPQAAAFACHVAAFAAAAPRLTTLEVTGLGIHLAVSAHRSQGLGSQGHMLALEAAHVFNGPNPCQIVGLWDCG